jgi:Uma2 family endonuclease
LPVRRFTVDEYHRMIEEGLFAADERFELLEGWIVSKISRNPPHDACVARARKVLDQRLPGGWHIRVQSAVTTADSEPEPDLAVVAGSELDFSARHPAATDTALVVEVANTTLDEDRTLKARVYAAARFETYWIINIVDRCVEVYTGPSSPAGAVPMYAERRIHPVGDSVPLRIRANSVTLIAVGDLLP